MKVLDNCTLAPILARKISRTEAEETAMRFLERVRIPERAHKVTHEIGFARQVADRVIFMADGRIVEEAPPEAFFENPANERRRTFLGQVVGH